MMNCAQVLHAQNEKVACAGWMVFSGLADASTGQLIASAWPYSEYDNKLILIVSLLIPTKCNIFFSVFSSFGTSNSIR